MANIEDDFGKWLIDTKKVKNNTASTYIRNIVSIYKKNFDIQKYHLDNNDWENLSENLLPLLVKYYELSNKEYFVDRVTIWHALDYFAKVIGFINDTKYLNKDENLTVKLYLYCYEGDFYIDSVNFKYLLNYVQIFNSFCYSREKHKIDFRHEETNIFLNKIREIIDNNNLPASSINDSALHIIYGEAGVSQKKTVLTHYCSFLYDLTGAKQYDYQNHFMLINISIENPNSKIGGNYQIAQNLTGATPLQIELKDNTRVYIHDEKDLPSFVLILSDLMHIFHLDKETVSKYFSNNNIISNKEGSEITNIDRSNTVLRTYFDINSVNVYLEQHHHLIKDKYADVDYALIGYEEWKTRKEAIDILEISHNAFHNLVTSNNCSYLNYLEETLRSAKDKKHYKYYRYYENDLKHLKNTRLVKEAQGRKTKYKN